MWYTQVPRTNETGTAPAASSRKKSCADRSEVNARPSGARCAPSPARCRTAVPVATNSRQLCPQAYICIRSCTPTMPSAARWSAGYRRTASLPPVPSRVTPSLALRARQRVEARGGAAQDGVPVAEGELGEEAGEFGPYLG